MKGNPPRYGSIAYLDSLRSPVIGTYGYSIDLVVGPRKFTGTSHASRCACCRLARMRRHRLSIAHRQAREART
jgi:hypothetical protein